MSIASTQFSIILAAFTIVYGSLPQSCATRGLSSAQVVKCYCLQFLAVVIILECSMGVQQRLAPCLRVRSLNGSSDWSTMGAQTKSGYLRKGSQLLFYIYKRNEYQSHEFRFKKNIQQILTTMLQYKYGKLFMLKFKKNQQVSLFRQIRFKVLLIKYNFQFFGNQGISKSQNGLCEFRKCPTSYHRHNITVRARSDWQILSSEYHTQLSGCFCLCILHSMRIYLEKHLPLIKIYDILLNFIAGHINRKSIRQIIVVNQTYTIVSSSLIFLERITLSNRSYTQLMSIRQKRKIADNHIFHIKIGPNAEKLNVKDPAFLKILEQEYATRYLENLGVEATQKNIHRILRENPLQNCEIIQSRLNGGLHTDTITIVAKTVDDSVSKKIENQTVSSQMLQVLDLKPMKLKKEINYHKSQPPAESEKKQKSSEKEQVNLQILSFDIRSMKEKYIFPFNQNFKRKLNYKMKDSTNILDIDREQSKIIYEAKIFNFPFTQIKLSIKTLKELQTPISTKLSDIVAFLQKYYQEFPTSIFPITTEKKVTNNHLFSSFLDKTEHGQPQKKKSELQRFTYLIFQQKDVDKAFQISKSEENAKFIGVFLHLAYWSIFGGVNPIQVDRLMKRKMYTMMIQTLEYFQIKMESKRLWSVLGFPLLLLTLKMAAHYFFSIQYPRLFQSEESVKYQANELALDKILYFIEKLFDQSNINGRFIFLQSDIDGEKGNFIKDKKFIRKRIFGTSPSLNLVLSDPKNGKTRSIMAKNIQIDQQDGTISDQKYLKNLEVDKESQQKLLNLALHKIKARIQDLNGGHNPIINLDDS